MSITTGYRAMEPSCQLAAEDLLQWREIEAARDFTVSRDGAWLATVHDYSPTRVWLWDLGRGHPVRAVSPRGSLPAFFFNAASDRFVMADTEGVRVWSMADFQCVSRRLLPEGWESMRHVQCSGDDVHVAALLRGCRAMQPDALALWRVTGDEPGPQWVLPLARDVDFHFAVEGTRLAFIQGRHQLQMVETNTGRAAETVTYDGRLLGLAMNSCGTKAVAQILEEPAEDTKLVAFSRAMASQRKQTLRQPSVYEILRDGRCQQHLSLRELPSGREIWRIPHGLATHHYQFKFSADDRYIAYFDAQRWGLIEAASGREPCQRERPRGYGRSAMGFTADNQLLVDVHGEKLQAWSLDGQLQWTSSGTVSTRATTGVTDPALCSLSGQGEVLEVERNSGQVARRFDHGLTIKTVDVSDFRISSAGDQLRWLTADGVLRCWCLRRGEVETTELLELPNQSQVAWDATGQRLAVASAEGVSVWRASPLEKVGSLARQGSTEAPRAIALSPDGELLAVSTSPGEIEVWDLTQFSLREKIRLPLAAREWATDQACPLLMSFSPQGQSLVVITNDDDSSRVFRWDRPDLLDRRAAPARDGSALTTILTLINDMAGVIRGCVFHPTKPDLAILRDDQADWLIWCSLEGERRASEYAARCDGCCAAGWSPDGSRLAVGYTSGEVGVWAPATAAELWRSPGHRQPVHTVRYLPDGQQLISAAGDGTLRLWDARGGECRAIFAPLPEQQWATAKPDGRFKCSPGGTDFFWHSQGVRRFVLGELDSQRSQPLRMQPGEELLSTP